MTASIGGIDTSCLQVRGQAALVFAEHFRSTHARVDYGDLGAGVDDDDVLLKHHIVGGEEASFELLGHAFHGGFFHQFTAIAECERSVRDDGHLHIAEHVMVEAGRFRRRDRLLCLSGNRPQNARRERGGKAGSSNCKSLAS
jgi:hypothetical protein